MVFAGWVVLAAAGSLLLTGSGELAYYGQSIGGHLRLLAAARPVQEWLQDENTSPQLRERLVLAQRLRAFAVDELRLPDNASYRRYADLQRSAAVWNVVAAPEFSLALKTWCFPVTGCIGYRGYFDEAEARRDAQPLRSEGLEVSVYPVPAYSTLGWMNWAGGDPLLNTFIHYPEGELARMLFHELAHQVVYVRDDTMFNESFSVAVERLGVQRWLQQQASERVRREYEELDARRREFRALQQATRARLQAVYGSPDAQEIKAQRKQAVMEEFRQGYHRLRESWGGDPLRWRGYTRWVEQANNAAFGVQAAYDELVPAFEALFAREGGDWQRFYDAVRALAALDRQERRNRLKEIAGG